MEAAFREHGRVVINARRCSILSHWEKKVGWVIEWKWVNRLDEEHASSRRCPLNVWAAFQIEIPWEKLAIVSQLVRNDTSYFPSVQLCSFVPILIYPLYLNPINGLQLIFSTNIISQGKSIHTCTFQRKERSMKRASTRLNTVSIRRTERSEWGNGFQHRFALKLLSQKNPVSL